MKKGLNIIFALSIILCISLIKPLQTVEAKDTKIAAGAWLTGTEIDVDATIPASLNILTKGVQVSKPGLICHPFHGGRFHWVGEIRQLKNGEWVKLKTTNDWYPDKEGQFMSCAQAPAAGTYALFGYYNGPLEVVSDIPSVIPSGTPFDCSTVNWDAILLNAVDHPVDLPDVYLYPWFYNAPIGTTVTYSVTGMDPDHAYGGMLTGNGLIGSNGYVIFGMNQLTIPPEDPWESLTVDFSFLGCTFTQVFTNYVN